MGDSLKDSLHSCALLRSSDASQVRELKSQGICCRRQDLDSGSGLGFRILGFGGLVGPRFSRRNACQEGSPACSCATGAATVLWT